MTSISRIKSTRQEWHKTHTLVQFESVVKQLIQIAVSVYQNPLSEVYL